MIHANILWRRKRIFWEVMCFSITPNRDIDWNEHNYSIIVIKAIKITPIMYYMSWFMSSKFEWSTWTLTMCRDDFLSKNDLHFATFLSKGTQYPGCISLVRATFSGNLLKNWPTAIHTRRFNFNYDWRSGSSPKVAFVTPTPFGQKTCNFYFFILNSFFIARILSCTLIYISPVSGLHDTFWQPYWISKWLTFVYITRTTVRK